MQKRIITISRQCGSGGHTIGRMVAEILGVSFYDKEIISMVAEKSNLAEEFIAEKGEYSLGRAFMQGLTHGGAFVAASSGTNSLQDKIQYWQADIIREAAEKESCVIVGRCADYILRNRDDCLNVFIRADLDYKLARSHAEHELDPDEGEKVLLKRDKARANHYNFYTNQTWGNPENYHMILDSGFFGPEKCAELIVQAFRA